MYIPKNSIEATTGHTFADIDRHEKNTPQKNDKTSNYKRTQTIMRNSSAHGSSFQRNGETDENRKKGKKKVATESASNSGTKQKSDKPVNRFLTWCTKCCRRQKSKILSKSSKSSLFERLKKKSKCCKKKRTRGKQDGTSSAARQDSVEESSREKGKTGEKTDRGKRSKKSRRGKRSKGKRKSDSSETVLSARASLADQYEKLIKDHVLGSDVPDFTKSCCYLCAKNTMAIAAAISGKVEKSHISIQASTEFFRGQSTSDKSCSPAVYVRTVQSSVKVKMRDMSTLYPEKKKSKKLKPKLKLKKFNIFPKIKYTKQPTVRTVACETDKSIRHNNIPQCRARRGTHCVTEKK